MSLFPVSEEKCQAERTDEQNRENDALHHGVAASASLGIEQAVARYNGVDEGGAKQHQAANQYAYVHVFHFQKSLSGESD